jgi:Hemerythrin HHE cation binding domain
MVASNIAFFEARSTAGGGHRPDIFDHLRAGHDRVRSLIAQLRRGRDSAADRQRLLDMLCDAVEAYGAASEQSLYAGFLASAEEEDKWPARYAVGVHDMSELMLFELSNLDVSGEAWQAEIGQLAEYLEDHFRLEADEIFPLAMTLFGGEQAARLGDKYEQARRHWVEVFGRVPDAPQPLPAKRPHASETVGRGRPATWMERLHRPSRAARPDRSGAGESR